MNEASKRYSDVSSIRIWQTSRHFDGDKNEWNNGQSYSNVLCKYIIWYLSMKYTVFDIFEYT